MIKQIKHLLTYGLLVLLSACSLICYPATGRAATDNNAEMVIDAQTGQVLYSKNADRRLAVASMSKLLTVAVIEHEIDAGHLKWSTKVKVTPAEAQLSTKSGYSNVPLQAGKSYTVKELTEAALIKSGDAATIALCRAQGQSTQKFVQQMGAAAKRIGLANYRFYNGVGLENQDMGSFKLPNTPGEAENEMTARDVAKLSQYLIQHYPDLLKITSQPTLKWDGKVYENSNELLPGKPAAPKHLTIDGLKTGTSDKAGQCLASTGTYQGHRIITVVMHANDRFAETKKIDQQVFEHWTSASQPEKMTVSVAHGQKKRVAVQAKQAMVVWQPQRHQVQPKLQVDKKYRSGNYLVKAPLKRNQRIGEFTYHQLTGLDGQPLQISAYPMENIRRSGLLGWLEAIF